MLKKAPTEPSLRESSVSYGLEDIETNNFDSEDLVGSEVVLYLPT
jgi:hypothetical protein